MCTLLTHTAARLRRMWYEWRGWRISHTGASNLMSTYLVSLCGTLQAPTAWLPCPSRFVRASTSSLPASSPRRTFGIQCVMFVLCSWAGSSCCVRGREVRVVLVGGSGIIHTHIQTHTIHTIRYMCMCVCVYLYVCI